MRKQISAFAKEMEVRMARYDSTKGDTWKTMPLEKLYEEMEYIIDKVEYQIENGMTTCNEDMVDIANYLMMIHWRNVVD